jgi:hypothetical protein
MRGRRAQRREAEAEAERPVTCTGTCQRTFANRSAWEVAHDARRADPCLPGHTIESMLVERRGVWYSRGSEPR